MFIPCLGAYLTPDLLGGGKTVMAGNLIQNQFTTARDWPFGSAVSLVLMAIVMVAHDRCDALARKRTCCETLACLSTRRQPFAFLHLPLLVLAVFSFNESRFTVWEGFSLRWYKAALAAMRNSRKQRGTASSSHSLPQFSPRPSARSAPMGSGSADRRSSPAVCTLAGHAGDRDGRFAARLLPVDVPIPASAARHAHGRPRARHVLDRLCRDRRYGAAAHDRTRARRSRPGPRRQPSGRHSGSSLCRSLCPAIASAALLAFTISFDDYVITSMVAGVDSETLPMVIYAMARRGANPVVNAISTADRRRPRRADRSLGEAAQDMKRRTLFLMGVAGAAGCSRDTPSAPERLQLVELRRP